MDQIMDWVATHEGLFLAFGFFGTLAVMVGMLWSTWPFLFELNLPRRKRARKKLEDFNRREW